MNENLFNIFRRRHALKVDRGVQPSPINPPTPPRPPHSSRALPAEEAEFGEVFGGDASRVDRVAAVGLRTQEFVVVEKRRKRKRRRRKRKEEEEEDKLDTGDFTRRTHF
ncbi:uncharacterized protein V6R79_023578 [Siganus canaliculatus]